MLGKVAREMDVITDCVSNVLTQQITQTVMTLMMLQQFWMQDYGNGEKAEAITALLS